MKYSKVDLENLEKYLKEKKIIYKIIDNHLVLNIDNVQYFLELKEIKNKEIIKFDEFTEYIKKYFK